jgi:hypothetical protein
MKRWIESLLIAVSASLVTLLVAWSASKSPDQPSAAPSSDAPAARQRQQPGSLTAARADQSSDVLAQLALLGDPASQDVSDLAPLRADGDKPQDIGRAHRSSGRSRPELSERCVEVARDIDPVLGKQLANLRQQNPAEFDRNMRIVGRKLLAMAELKERDPDLYGAKLSEMRLDLNVRQKGRELREARAAGNRQDTEMLEKQLRTALAIQLGMSIKSRAEIICQLQDRINIIRAEIDHQASTFNEIVEARFHDLVNGPAQPTAAAASE